jgi:hypothetical protein
MIQRTDRLEADSYHAFHFYLVPPEQQKEVLQKILAFPAQEKYFVTDSWSTTHALQLLHPTTPPVASFLNSSSMLVPVGLYIGGEEHIRTDVHILQLLWSTNYFGPDIFVYRLEHNPPTL